MTYGNSELMKALSDSQLNIIHNQLLSTQIGWICTPSQRRTRWLIFGLAE